MQPFGCMSSGEFFGRKTREAGPLKAAIAEAAEASQGTAGRTPLGVAYL
jgi:hypothetical protein